MRIKSQNVRVARRFSFGSEEGSTIVEFALASTIFMAILFGIIETSIAVYSYDFVSEAARDAARYAIVRGATCSNMPDCNASNTVIQTHVQSLNYPAINTAQLTTTTTWYAASTTGTPATTIWTSCGVDVKCNAIGNAVQVIVDYKFPFNIPFWKRSTIDMKNSSMMVISQ